MKRTRKMLRVQVFVPHPRMHHTRGVKVVSARRASCILNRGDITVLTDSNWSQGLVLCVPARKRNLKESICFKLTNEC